MTELIDQMIGEVERLNNLSMKYKTGDANKAVSEIIATLTQRAVDQIKKNTDDGEIHATTIELNAAIQFLLSRGAILSISPPTYDDGPAWIVTMVWNKGETTDAFSIPAEGGPELYGYRPWEMVTKDRRKWMVQMMVNAPDEETARSRALERRAYYLLMGLAPSSWGRV